MIGGWLPGEGRRTNGSARCSSGAATPTASCATRAARAAGFTRGRASSRCSRGSSRSRDRSPFTGEPKPPRGSMWVEPRAGGRRWSSASGPPRGCCATRRIRGCVTEAGRHRDAGPRRGAGGVPGDPGARRAQAAEGRRSRRRWTGARCELSNFDKVLYPKAGFTKGDMIEYYARIAAGAAAAPARPAADAEALPERRGGQVLLREAVPVAPARLGPDGARCGAGRNKKDINFCLANDRPTLVWTSNLADIELHTSLSLADPIERPTMMVFDLDPGEPADIVAVLPGRPLAARAVRPAGPRGVPEDVGLEGAPGVRAAEHRRRDLRRHQAVRARRSRSCSRSSTPSSSCPA